MKTNAKYKYRLLSEQFKAFQVEHNSGEIAVCCDCVPVFWLNWLDNIKEELFEIINSWLEAFRQFVEHLIADGA